MGTSTERRKNPTWMTRVTRAKRFSKVMHKETSMSVGRSRPYLPVKRCLSTSFEVDNGRPHLDWMKLTECGNCIPKCNVANSRYQYRILKELNHGVKVGFDKFARLATLVCGTEICIVNFLDDRTQYTSAEAAPEPWLNHVPIPKPLSICVHTILRNSAEVFEIPDTTKDWRFNGKVIPPVECFDCSRMLSETHTFDSTQALLSAQSLDTISGRSVSLTISLNALQKIKHPPSKTLPI